MFHATFKNYSKIMNYNKANIFLHELQQVKEDFLRPF